MSQYNIFMVYLLKSKHKFKRGIVVSKKFVISEYDVLLNICSNGIKKLSKNTGSYNFR